MPISIPISQRAGAWFALMLGLGLLGIAGLNALSVAGRVAGADKLEGMVVDLKLDVSIDKDGRRREHYFPVIEFRASRGELRTFTASYGTDPPSYAVGEQVTVLWDPLEVRRPELRAFLPLYFLPLVFGFIGCVFVVIGGGILATPRMLRWSDTRGHWLVVATPWIVLGFGLALVSAALLLGLRTRAWEAALLWAAVGAMFGGVGAAVVATRRWGGNGRLRSRSRGSRRAAPDHHD